MIDDAHGPPVLSDRKEDDALLYDWFKHLTSLSLLTLGGILSLSQVGDADIKQHTLMGVLIAVGASGVLAFSGAEQIVQARSTGAPLPKQVHILRKLASGLLGMGVGAFLYIFTSVVY